MVRFFAAVVFVGMAMVALTTAGCRRAPALNCGPITCDPRASYCEIIKTDVPRLPSDYHCKPLPEACRAPATGPRPAARTCACFPVATRCGFCSVVDTAAGPGFRRTCVGGA
jgi:hypothetical protein